MAKILLMYYSRTGNTEKLARSVLEGMRQVKGVEITFQPIDQVAVREWLNFDALVIGAPVYYGGPPAEVKEAIDASVDFHGKMRGKLGGAFASSANVGGGNETTALDLLHAWLIHGMLVLGDCEGDHYGPVAIGAPDQRARENAVRYGRLFAETALRLFG